MEKRRKLLLKSGDAANQKELYRKGGGRIQRTVNQGMSGTQGVAGAQKMEWELKGGLELSSRNLAIYRARVLPYA